MTARNVAGWTGSFAVYPGSGGSGGAGASSGAPGATGFGILIPG